MALQNYDENSIRTLGPRDSVRENYGMYIGSVSTQGMHHLLTEIVANSMDEAQAGFGKLIIVKVDSAKNQVQVIDEGRGIPFRLNADGKYALREMCTSLHSGGKFSGERSYKSSLGLHGLGATVTNYMSSYFRIDVVRADGKAHIEFDNGVETSFNIEDCTNAKTGSTVTFIPDPTMFIKLKWNQETIKEELQLHALLNNGLTFRLIWDGKQVAEYNYKNGIRDMLDIKFGDLKPLTNPIYFSTVVNEDQENECAVEFALRYCTEGSEKIYAFTNGGYNPDYGTHVTGFKSAWTSLINTKSREYKLLDENMENLDGNLIRKGMVLVLSIKMAERPMFAEQTKLKLTSPGARGMVSQAVGKLNIPKADLEAIVKKILTEKKAEEAAQRQRDAVKRISAGGKNINTLREVSEKFSDASNRTGYRELFFVEGLSAGGSAKEARNSKIQGIYPLRGKPLNTHSRELADIIKNQEIKDTLAILGCGIGEKFNLRNLRYDKIIFMADADADGMHINCLLTTLFLVHLPELIEAGKVYCAVPPLYKMTKGKDKQYTSDETLKEEYAAKGYDIQRLKGLGEMNPEELWESTMDPDTRHLIQLKPENLEATLALYDTIMGNSPKARKEFIIANAAKYRFFEEDSYDDFDGDE